MTRFLPKLLEHHPELRDAVTWITRNHGPDVERLLAGARKDLASAGKFPPLARLCAYFKVMVVGEFLVLWKAKNAHRSWKDIAEEGDPTELKLAQRTIIATADARVFRRTLRQLARKRQAEQLGVHLGDESDFESFVATESGQIARKFFENFDHTRKKASLAAAKYVRMAATSLFLDKRTRPVRSGATNLFAYLKRSPRLSMRTKLAIKIAYLPYPHGLNKVERQYLQEHFGWRPPAGKKLPIKEIASRLKFKNPAVLYRKLYRARKWCQAFRPARTPEATEAA
jgi:hypothetical protein